MAKLLVGLGLVSEPDAAVRGLAAPGPPIAPLIALPTTAGSGSEATHFAVVYVDGVKHSLAHESLFPSWAIVDPTLTHSLSPRLTAVSGIDAFCQAVESTWSIHSTAETRAWAARAIRLSVDYLPDAVAHPTQRARRMMSKAAFLAGRAINTTRTTAAHALSYPLTMHYGVPHGQAVCLTLGPLLVFNSQTREDDVMDRRGVDHVHRVIDDLAGLLGCRDAESAARRISELVRSVGLETSLGALGLPAHEAAAHAVAGVNAERLVNNPRRLTGADLRALLLVQAAP
jgi:alcohol dehydrogenase class IV